MRHYLRYGVLIALMAFTVVNNVMATNKTDVRKREVRVGILLPLHDVDGDGQVNIADVTALIDMLLQPKMIMQNQHDIDGSGQLNIADVTALIDHILNH